MLYVDHYRAPFGGMKMSHLMADTKEELLRAAGAAGSSTRTSPRSTSTSQSPNASWR